MGVSIQHRATIFFMYITVTNIVLHTKQPKLPIFSYYSNLKLM